MYGGDGSGDGGGGGRQRVRLSLSSFSIVLVVLLPFYGGNFNRFEILFQGPFRTLAFHLSHSPASPIFLGRSTTDGSYT